MKPRRLIGYPKYLYFARRGRHDRSRSRPYRRRKYRETTHQRKPHRVKNLFDRINDK